jgi:hypothetical protein
MAAVADTRKRFSPSGWQTPSPPRQSPYASASFRDRPSPNLGCGATESSAWKSSLAAGGSGVCSEGEGAAWVGPSGGGVPGGCGVAEGDGSAVAVAVGVALGVAVAGASIVTVSAVEACSVVPTAALTVTL